MKQVFCEFGPPLQVDDICVEALVRRKLRCINVATDRLRVLVASRTGATVDLRRAVLDWHHEAEIPMTEDLTCAQESLWGWHIRQLSARERDFRILNLYARPKTVRYTDNPHRNGAIALLRRIAADPAEPETRRAEAREILSEVMDVMGGDRWNEVRDQRGGGRWAALPRLISAPPFAPVPAPIRLEVADCHETFLVDAEDHVRYGQIAWKFRPNRGVVADHGLVFAQEGDEVRTDAVSLLALLHPHVAGVEAVGHINGDTRDYRRANLFSYTLIPRTMGTNRSGAIKNLLRQEQDPQHPRRDAAHAFLEECRQLPRDKRGRKRTNDWGTE